MYVDLDVYRSCFGDSAEKLYNLKDFECLNLSSGWYYKLHKDGTGRKIKFPVRLTPKLHMQNVYVKDVRNLRIGLKPVDVVLVV